MNCKTKIVGIIHYRKGRNDFLRKVLSFTVVKNCINTQVTAAGYSYDP